MKENLDKVKKKNIVKSPFTFEVIKIYDIIHAQITWKKKLTNIKEIKWEHTLHVPEVLLMSYD